jgi:hypothetical protein
MNSGTDLLVAQRRKQFANHLLTRGHNRDKAGQRICRCRPAVTTVHSTPPATAPGERVPANFITQTLSAGSCSPDGSTISGFQAAYGARIALFTSGDYAGNRIKARASHRESKLVARFRTSHRARRRGRFCHRDRRKFVHHHRVSIRDCVCSAFSKLSRMLSSWRKDAGSAPSGIG